MNTEKMIARAVRKGANEVEARAMLTELMSAHDGDNLRFALQYNGFIA